MGKSMYDGDTDLHKRERLIQLRQILETFYDQSELRTLCFDLGVEYDGLRGEGKKEKARELLGYLERHSHLPDLMKLGRLQRPDIPWDEVSPPPPEPTSSTFKPAASPEPLPGSGDTISATISGASISGQVAVGKEITQIQTVGAPSPEVTESDLARLHQALAELKTRVEATAPAEKKSVALAKVAELEDAVTKSEISELELATMEAVKLWFARRLPELAEAVTRVVTHAVVRERVQAAGDALLIEFQRRFDAT